MIYSHRVIISYDDYIRCNGKKICKTVDFSIDKSKSPVR